jgi:hypothetical protein
MSIYHVYKQQYIKMLLATGAFALTFLLLLLDKVFLIKPDIFGGLLYISIVFMTVYLGEGFRLYDKIFWWDILAHILAGIVGVNFGIAISMKFENMNKFYILLFSFTFSLALQTIWEVFEYTSDRLFNTNCQKWKGNNPFANHSAKSEVQPVGLVDTMNDTIACMIGTLASCIVWWYVL